MVHNILVIDDIVTQQEATDIILKMERDPLSKEPVQTENSLYSRVYLPLSDLSRQVWERIETKVQQTFPEWPDLNYVRPVWAVTKYDTDGHLGVHVDGRNRGRGWQSWLTITIYLNEPPDFGGGSTCFYRDSGGLNPFKEVQPRIGRAVIFPQDMYHSGQLVTNGIKYIMRSDIMEPICAITTRQMKIKTIRFTLNND